MPNKTDLQKAIPLMAKYSFDTIEDVKKLISDLSVSSMYGGKNADGEDVIVMRELGSGIEIITFQSNGWISKSSYTEFGIFDGQWFDGRWDR